VAFGLNELLGRCPGFPLNECVNIRAEGLNRPAQEGYVIEQAKANNEVRYKIDWHDKVNNRGHDHHERLPRNLSVRPVGVGLDHSEAGHKRVPDSLEWAIF